MSLLYTKRIAQKIAIGHIDEPGLLAERVVLRLEIAVVDRVSAVCLGETCPGLAVRVS